ncbi:transglycosylase family protein [Streptomyces oceani]|uniref:Transglycosylase n=1 Tax=Streptomyces oceani TaxID=1075402 RepID=A0A1E7KFZ5_9ACTN|nr:transglycosylase family protein [Streptomyces oceani]OEV02783.1 transglycosylase [Streptomyces oceani]
MFFATHGRHRRPGRAARIATLAGVAGAAVAVPLMSATSAQAASVDTWGKVAQCESGGDWQINTGNGYYGGLQFSESSWAAAGGTQYAPRADQASKQQQIATAERLLEMQGPGAWACASAGGLSQGGPAADVAPEGDAASDDAPQQQEPQQQPEKPEQNQQSQQSPQTGGDTYTVRSGDTLGSIADEHGTSWQRVFEANKSVIGDDANLILPGQELTV